MLPCGFLTLPSPRPGEVLDAEKPILMARLPAAPAHLLLPETRGRCAPASQMVTPRAVKASRGVGVRSPMKTWDDCTSIVVASGARVWLCPGPAMTLAPAPPCRLQFCAPSGSPVSLCRSSFQQNIPILLRNLNDCDFFASAPKI